MEAYEMRKETGVEAQEMGGDLPHQKPYLHSEKDKKDMRRMGKEQKFRRNFKVVSISSFCLATMMGFVYIPVNTPALIQLAGTGGTIVIYIANFFGFLAIVLCQAEMASIAPTAGGQYHWVSEFAPESKQKVLSYLAGWLASLSWMVGVASGLFLAGNLIPAMITISSPGFVPHAWQGYLFVVAIITVCFLINGYLAKHLPLLEGFVLCFTVLAFIAIVAVLLILSPKLTSSEVFQTFGSDLGSTGALEIVAAQASILYTLLGFDATAHMAEETQQAAIVIPRATVACYSIIGLANFVILVAFSYCFVDPTAAFSNSNGTGYPFLEVYITATGSAQGAVTLTAIQVVLIILSGINVMAATSRQVFAFARDGGLPFNSFIAKVDRKNGVPLNSLIVLLLFTVLISLIELGSTVAFNAIVSLQLMAIGATYEVSMLCMAWRRMYGKPLPPSPWSLGRYGLAMNLCAAGYGLYLLAYAAMPGAYPVTAANFNWAPVMFAGVLMLSLGYYVIWARKIYQGPVVLVMKD